MTQKPRFVSFEGGEGCGKSTQVRLFYEHLKREGVDVVLTREPGGSAGAEKIREILLGQEKLFLPQTEVLLNFAARQDHVEKLIKPALARGANVISDRFFDSTYIYQGYAQGVDLKLIDAVRQLAIGDFAPDLTILLDIEPEKALARAVARGDANHFEAMGIEFHRKIRQGFLQLAKQSPDRFVIIDADKSVDELHSLVLHHFFLNQQSN